jgi:hypothetical protein
MSEKKLDQYAESIFAALGCDVNDEHLVETYVSFKKVKDFLQPGRLSAEGHAFVLSLANLTRPASSTKAAKPAAKAKQPPAEKKADEPPVELDTEGPFGKE